MTELADKIDALAEAGNFIGLISLCYEERETLTRALRDAERMREALEACLEELYAPEASCSCHISPPCGDCVDYASVREAIALARQALGDNTMTELKITQADRDSAASYWGNDNPPVELRQALAARGYKIERIEQ